jgi:RNA recognition motif-containing protein
VRIPIDKHSGRQRAIALVTFDSEKEAKKVLLKTDRVDFLDRKLRVQLADKLKTAQMIGND